MTLATIDFVIGGVLVISLFIGTWRGFVKEAISILAWVSSFIISITFFRPNMCGIDGVDGV